MVVLNRSFPEKAFSQLGLAHTMTVQPTVEDEAQLRRALRFASAQQPRVSAFIKRHLKSVVMIRRTRSDAPIISSTSFAEHPGVAFIARCCSRFVPPMCVAILDEEWMIADNLLHESIHQLLFERARNEGDEGLFARLRQVDNRLTMPWRAAPWSLEQAYHGYQVYLALAHFRRDVAMGRGGADRALIARAATAAVTCAHELARGMIDAGLTDHELALDAPPPWQCEVVL